MKNLLIRALSLMLVISSLVGVLSACGDNGHKHTYSARYYTDGEAHWQVCSCGEASERTAHTGGSATCTEKARCEICQVEYGELAPHDYKYVQDADKHWGACSCGATTEAVPHEYTTVKTYSSKFHWLGCVCGRTSNGIEHTVVDFNCFCGYKAPGWDHVHSFDILKCDYDGHWYECICKEPGEKVAHTGGTATCTSYAECEVCTVKYGALGEHEYTILRVTESEHRYECKCGKTQEAVAHSYTNNVCECGYKVESGHVHDFSILKTNDVCHWYECECKLSSAAEEHKGGTASWNAKAVCEVCQKEYGELAHKWNNGELIEPSTADKTGIITYTCELCGAKRNEIVPMGTVITTRADLEAGIAEVAWAYYLKGEKLQYDSAALSAISNHYGGTCRHTREVSPEFGTSDTTIYSVCTGYPTKVYLEAIGRNMWEQTVSPNGILTMWLWLAADNQAEDGFVDYYKTESDPITEGDRDLALVRWMDFEKYLENEANEVDYAYSLGTFDSSAFCDWYTDGTLEFREDWATKTYSYYLDGEPITADDAKLLLRDYILEKENGEYVHLRPGDLFTEDTHTLIYVGYGFVLDCSGHKYTIGSGEDQVEAAGIVNRNTVEYILMNRASSDYVLTRPLDYYAKDYDGNPGNDIIKFGDEYIELTAATGSRIEYPAIEIDRTVDITPYGTAEKDGTVTYSIKISNKTNEAKYKKWKANYIPEYAGEVYVGLPVSEMIPVGTEFVSASEGYTLENGVLSWKIDVPIGECVEITYTVRVTAEIGSKIVSDGGMVGNIPSNSITNTVGYKKLSEEQIAVIKSILNSNTEDFATTYGTNLDFAEGIYRALGVDINLPSIEEIIENLFTPTYFEKQTSMTQYYADKDVPIVMYVPQEQVSEEYKTVQSMLVDRYFGGYRMFATDIEKFEEIGLDNFDLPSELDKTILDFSFDYLEVGDILVYAKAKNRENTTLTSELASYKIYIYAGDGSFISLNSSEVGRIYTGEDAEKILTSAFKSTNDLFFLLRPTEAIDVNSNQ